MALARKPRKNDRRSSDALDAARDWEEVFLSVQDVLAVIDEFGRILRVNRGFGGRSAEEMVGRPAAEIFQHGGGAEGEAVVQTAQRTKREASSEIVGLDREQALSVSAYPVHGDGGKISKVVLHVRDVTAKRLMETQLFQSAKLAAIGEMAAGVAHELNSPLTAVIGNAGLLLRRTPEEDRSYRMLSDIKTCGQRCKKIISDMLTFARQDSYVFEPLQINDVVIRGLELIEYQLNKARVVVERNLARGLPLVLGNAQQVEQVLVNLALNARDALDGSTRKVISVTTDFGTLENGQLGVAVAVADTGAGIEPDHIGRIFNPFFTTKEGTRGTGLGLSVSMGIARAHGGTISVESRPGEGSTFKLVLPVMAQQIADYLGEGGVRTTSGPGLARETMEELRPALELARRLGRAQAQLGPETLSAVEVEGASQGSTWGASLMTAAALEGLFAEREGTGVSLANARVVARDRGVRVAETAFVSGEDYRYSMRITVQGGDERFSLVGAVFSRNEPRLVELDGVSIEAPLEGHLLVCWADDRPGLVGSIASKLAGHGASIRQMRSGGGGGEQPAVAVFNVDIPVDDDLLAELGALPSLTRVDRVSL